MKGPNPKDPQIRRRRNRVSTAAKLSGGNVVPKGTIPELPAHPNHNVSWHPRTRVWWQKVWRSPMAGEYLEIDVEGLYLIAAMRDQLYRDASSGRLAAELRQWEMRYGLAPLDRRRLQWEVGRVEGRQRPTPPRRAPAAKDDPRTHLRVVK